MTTGTKTRPETGYTETRNRSFNRQEFLSDVITTAFEGGIGYWAQAGEYKWWSPTLDGGTAEHLYGQPNAYGVIWDGDSELWYTIDVDKVASAIKRIVDRDVPDSEVHLAEGYRDLVRIADAENDAGEIDADAADWIVQVACFGEVVYG